MITAPTHTIAGWELLTMHEVVWQEDVCYRGCPQCPTLNPEAVQYCTTEADELPQSAEVNANAITSCSMSSPLTALSVCGPNFHPLSTNFLFQPDGLGRDAEGVASQQPISPFQLHRRHQVSSRHQLWHQLMQDLMKSPPQSPRTHQEVR
jgi:hypothetical protein